jgi:transposase-like protein
MLTVIPGEGSGHEGGKKDGAASLIEEIVREGARRILAEALQAEVDTYIAQFAGERDENGRRLVVRNGHHQPREVLTSAGVIQVTVPRVNDKRTDPATGWNAPREVFPGSREGRCWFHRTANVLAALPKSAHPGAKKALAEIWGAEDKDHALAAVKAFEAAYSAKFPKAAAKITDDAAELLAFYDCPAEHWVHLRTTNPIESTFATVRHRTKVTKGPGSRAAGLAMAFKLIESAQDRWRAVNASHLVALVRAGATCINGKLVERTGAGAEHREAAA